MQASFTRDRQRKKTSPQQIRRWIFVGIASIVIVAIIIANSITYFTDSRGNTSLISPLLFIFASIISIMFLILGSLTWLYTSHKQKKITFYFFCVCYSISLTFAAEAAATNNSNIFFSDITSFGSCSSIAALVIFFYHFPDLTLPAQSAVRQRQRIPWRGIILFCSHIVGTATIFTSLAFSLTGQTYEILRSTIIVNVTIMTMNIVLRISHSWFYCMQHELRQQLQQLRWIASGFILGSSLFWIFTLLPQLVPMPYAPLPGELTTLPIIIFLFTLGVAVLRYQLLIFTIYIRKSLIFAVRALGYMAVIYCCLLISSNSVQKNDPHVLLKYGLVLSITLVCSLAIWRLAEPCVDFFFFRERRRYRQIFDQSLYSSQISVDDIARIMTTMAVEAFEIPQVCLYLLEETRSVYRLTPDLLDEKRAFNREQLAQLLMQRLGSIEAASTATTGQEIDIAHPIFKQLAVAIRPLLLQEITTDSANRPAGISRYITPDGDREGDHILLAPIFIQKRLVGILVLGERDGERSYASEDFDIIALLLKRISPLLETALLTARANQQKALLNNLYSASSASGKSYTVSTIEQTARRYAQSVAAAIAGRAEVWLPQDQGYHCFVSEGHAPRLIETMEMPPLQAEDWQTYFFEAGSDVTHLPSFFIFPPETSFAWLPLHYGAQRAGILLLTYIQPHSFVPEERHALQMFARSLQAALDNVRMVNDLQQAYKKQQELDHLKDRFIDTVTQQLRIPLKRLDEYVETIEHYHTTLPAAERGKLIRQAYKTSGDLSIMLDTLFNVSQPRQEIALRTVALSTFVDTIISSLHTTQHKVSHEIPEHMQVSTDVFLLRQICTSILKRITSQQEYTVCLRASHSFTHVFIHIDCSGAQEKSAPRLTFSQSLIKSLLQEIDGSLEITPQAEYERITIGLPMAQEAPLKTS
ncbi:hypothetical protein [Dictyobacter arantiisoli]|uniref:histidine kinase n=1 Tax=Dictyobacter arantiisoli TaxID=2014874 RepID=A0A5A5TE16_9CHLR|nr:hypothetical protein [Dictyobacter arantiisoli]GCF09557.1 hypothetical protein KDI_31210 [Dictyobacter arantiisoli]